MAISLPRRLRNLRRKQKEQAADPKTESMLAVLVEAVRALADYFASDTRPRRGRQRRAAGSTSVGAVTRTETRPRPPKVSRAVAWADREACIVRSVSYYRYALMEPSTCLGDACRDARAERLYQESCNLARTVLRILRRRAHEGLADDAWTNHRVNLELAARYFGRRPSETEGKVVL